MSNQDSKELNYEYGLKEYDEGNFDRASEYYRRSIEIAHREEPTDSLFIFEKSIELAHIYLEFNESESGLPLVSEAFHILQRDTDKILLSEQSADFAELLGNLTFYFEQFDKAVVCYSQAEYLYSNINNKSLAKAKKALAQSRLGEILVAIKELKSILAIDALDIEIKNKVRKYLSDIMVSTGQYKEALTGYQIIFDELMKNYEISTYWLLETLFNMATTNFELGNYIIALNQYKQVVSELALNKFPGTNRLKTETLMMIVKISIIIRDTGEAIRLLDSVDELSLLETDLIYYQILRAQIALFNLNPGKEDDEKYLDIISKYHIEEIKHDKDVEILTLQSNIHFQHGEIQDTIEILQKLIGYYQTDRNDFQISIYKMHLCQVLMHNGVDNQKCEILSQINDIESLISYENWGTFAIMNLVRIAQLCCRIEEYEHLYKTLNQIYNHEWDIIRSYALSGDKEQIFFQDIIDLLLNITFAASRQLNEKGVDLQEQYANLHIKIKSLFLLKNEIFRGLLAKADSPEINLILRYNQKMKELNSRTFSKSDDYHRLKMEVNSLENIIKRDTDYFGTIKELINIRWMDIREKLTAKEAAISFFRYECIEDSNSDRSGYSVYIILKDSTHPQFIDLDINDDFLIKVLPFNLIRNYESGGSFYLDVEIPIMDDLESLYFKVFKPTEGVLKSIQRIYFTVDGLLNYVPFNALVDKEGKFLIDKFELIHLQNLRDIKSLETEKAIDSIAIFGGIDFGRLYEKTKGENYGSSGNDNTLSALGQIQQADYENKEISELFSGKDYPKYMPEHLDMSTFRDVCGEKMPSCIHILTHGFFFNDEKKKYSFEDAYQYNTTDIRSHSNPMLRSGLFGSDYNYFINNTDIKSNEKGVITSYDISRSQLENTFLVTIHACESALGAVRSGETYGLARAFKIAGVNCVILTLWKIQYTRFYIRFYQHLLEDIGKDVRRAFCAAISDIRKELPNPYWWSGFVLIE